MIILPHAVLTLQRLNREHTDAFLALHFQAVLFSSQTLLVLCIGRIVSQCYFLTTEQSYLLISSGFLASESQLLSPGLHLDFLNCFYIHMKNNIQMILLIHWILSYVNSFPLISSTLCLPKNSF